MLKVTMFKIGADTVRMLETEGESALVIDMRGISKGEWFDKCQMQNL